MSFPQVNVISSYDYEFGWGRCWGCSHGNGRHNFKHIIETNFIDNNGVDNVKHLDVFDFFKDPSGKIDHLIRNRLVLYDWLLCLDIILSSYVLSFYKH